MKKKHQQYYWSMKMEMEIQQKQKQKSFDYLEKRFFSPLKPNLREQNFFFGYGKIHR